MVLQLYSAASSLAAMIVKDELAFDSLSDQDDLFMPISRVEGSTTAAGLALLARCNATLIVRGLQSTQMLSVESSKQVAIYPGSVYRSELRSAASMQNFY